MHYERKYNLKDEGIKEEEVDVFKIEKSGRKQYPLLDIEHSIKDKHYVMEKAL